MKDRLLDYYGKQVNQLFTSITIMFNQCFDCFTGFMVGQGDGGEKSVSFSITVFFNI